MSVLSARSIREILPVSPFVERGIIRGRSYGLSIAGYDVRCAQSIALHPGDFTLVSTVEEFRMPNDVLGLVKDKSSWARKGLSVFNTVIEPGWEGFLTMEIVNHGHEELIIVEGDPLAQIIFQWVDEETVGYTGKYNFQPNRPVEALFEV